MQNKKNTILTGTIKAFTLAIFVTLVSGCGDEEISLSQACEGLNGFCETGITDDSNCKRERQTGMVNAFKIENKLEDVPALQFNQLIALEKLKSCTHKQTLVEYVPVEQKYPQLPVKSPEKMSEEDAFKVQRYRDSILRRARHKRENYINTSRYLTRLSEDTAGNGNPHLLYWHWSRNHDKEALERLRGMYTAGKLKDYDLLFYLSQDYSRTEPDISRKMLFQSLEKYPREQYTEKTEESNRTAKYAAMNDDGRLHYEALRHLIQLYFSEKNYQKSYVFAQVLHLNNDRSADSDMIISYMKKNHAQKLDELDNIADDIHEALESGTFKKSDYPIL